MRQDSHEFRICARRESDAIVYRLFDSTRDEIAPLKSSIAGQYRGRHARRTLSPALGP
ncbi:MAG: hypothetical protein HXY30_13395 [Pseudorhodoplanes sp.]|nr:hypothetical protein [Pseudorhodoplanes sp.]